jgi:hypothetical protein
MTKFSTAPVAVIIPKRRERAPSQRAELQKQYRDAIENAIINEGEALIVELDPDEKPLTVRSRLQKAAQALGLDSVVIKRRGRRIVVYQPPES